LGKTKSVPKLELGNEDRGKVVAAGFSLRIRLWQHRLEACATKNSRYINS